MRMLRTGLPTMALLVAAQLGTTSAQEAETTPAAMDDERLGALIRRIDPQAVGGPGLWRLQVREREVMVITDARADRMRIITGIAPADALEQELLFRLMQANFDTALDARYAVAQGVLWSAFIHPLGARWTIASSSPGSARWSTSRSASGPPTHPARSPSEAATAASSSRSCSSGRGRSDVVPQATLEVVTRPAI